MGNSLNSDKIKEVIEHLGFDYRERPRTIYTMCPGCGEGDKLSILKDGGSTICYRGSCSFGGPRSFLDWVIQTGSISRQEAIELLYGEPARPIEAAPALKLTLKDPWGATSKPASDPIVVEQQWPPFTTVGLAAESAVDGVTYLIRRGIDHAVAEVYGIRYDSYDRRVVFPVAMNGKVYGWQARAIDPVEPGFRMRNNPGFQRARCVLFLDRLLEGHPAIIAEGPFDALKFHLCGGNVSTMGKAVSNEQLALIMARKPSALYLALDDDAAPEMRDIARRVNVPVFRITVPQAAVDRCRQHGKKADFGECTMDECVEAFRNARPFGLLSTAIYLKSPWEK